MMEHPRTDAWAIGTLISALISNSHELPRPEQNDPRRSLGSIQEESTPSLTHQDVVAFKKKKPRAINPTQKSIIPDDHLTHNLEYLDDGSSTLKGPGIGEDSLAEGC
jgi:hypothetical protein